MYVLFQKYECEVEAIAMKHAKKCKYGHSSPQSRPGLGENIFQVGISNFDKARAAQMVRLVETHYSYFQSISHKIHGA